MFRELAAKHLPVQIVGVTMVGDWSLDTMRARHGQEPVTMVTQHRKNVVASETTLGHFIDMFRGVNDKVHKLSVRVTSVHEVLVMHTDLDNDPRTFRAAMGSTRRTISITRGSSLVYLFRLLPRLTDWRILRRTGLINLPVKTTPACGGRI